MLPKLPQPVKRSKRYLISAPLQYRIRGERLWYRGVSRNMSQSGILFEGEAPLHDGVQLEILLTLRSGFTATKGTAVRFQGTVVRSVPDGLSAARIFSRRLRRVDPGGVKQLGVSAAPLPLRRPA